MRRFRFIGDPSKFQWLINPVPGNEYSIDEINRMRAHKGRYLDYLDLSIRKNDWQEVIETEPKQLHKDTDLGYFSLEIMKSLISSPKITVSKEVTNSVFISQCIELAKELIKQLDNEVNL